MLKYACSWTCMHPCSRLGRHLKTAHTHTHYPACAYVCISEVLMHLCQAWLSLFCSFLMTPPGKLTVAVLCAQPLMWVIMTSQTCSWEERRSWDLCFPFFFFFKLPTGILFRKKKVREEETEAWKERKRGEIKYLAKTKMRLCVHTNCSSNWCLFLCCCCFTSINIWEQKWLFYYHCLRLFNVNWWYLASRASHVLTAS